MNIQKAEFLSCCSDYRKCPQENLPEYAFIGRSNVGKSSLINCLCQQNGLAKTSSSPGKTQTIVHFKVDDRWFLADLPGYGYASVGKKQREQWQKMTRDYLLRRPNLFCVFVLVDLRIPPQKIDLEFLQFLGENELPLCVIGTKASISTPRNCERRIGNILSANASARYFSPVLNSLMIRTISPLYTNALRAVVKSGICALHSGHTG